MADFAQVAALRLQRADLEKSVQDARLSLDALRQQLSTQADATSRAGTSAKIAAAQTTLQTATTKLNSLLASINSNRAAQIAAGARLFVAPKRPVPAVLLPVRIETCFRELTAGVVQLAVRFYPDQIAIETHEPELTADEVLHAQKYGAQPAALTEEGKQQAWRRLARRLGINRAAWLHRLKERGVMPVQGRLAGWTRPACSRVMPDHFDVFLYDGATLLKKVSGSTVPDALAVLWNPTDDGDQANNELFDPDCLWISNFDSAKEKGMAVEIDMTGVPAPTSPDGYSVFVVGLKESANSSESATLLQNLLDNHHFTDGLAFLPADTPTNNTGDVPSGFSAKVEPDDVQSLEAGDGEKLTDAQSDGVRMAKALGIRANDVFTHIANASAVDEPYVNSMHTALWPALGGYFFKYLVDGAMPAAHQLLLRDHFASWVRARGPLPTLRVGKLPYGFLPVTSFTRWQYSAQDFATPPAQTDQFFYQHLHLNLLRLLSKVDKMPVPRIGESSDPDQELLQILSMQPGSQSVRVRPVVGDTFVSLMVAAGANAIPRTTVVNPRLPSANTLIADWVTEWDKAQTSARAALNELSTFMPGAPPPTWVKNAQILNLFPWGPGKSWDREKTVNHALSLSNVMQWVQGTNDLNGLLNELIRVARLLESGAQVTNSLVFPAAKKLAEIEKIPGQLERLLMDALDLHSYRLDAWISAFATKRLFRLRDTTPEGQPPELVLGAYGWVTGLLRNTKPHTSDGYILAPTPAHGVTAAVLRNGFLTHDRNNTPNPFCANLTSTRAHNAAKIIEGVREDQSLSALLGYQLERALHDARIDRFIEPLRMQYPLVANQEVPGTPAIAESVAARNVVDGLALVRAFQNPALRMRVLKGFADYDRARGIVHEGGGADPLLVGAIDAVIDAQDAVADVLMHEVVHNAAQGSFERSGAALEAMNASGRPPELDGLRARQPGRRYSERVCLLLPPAVSDPRNHGARWNAEPRVAEWIGSLVGSLNRIVFEAAADGAVYPMSLGQLKIDAIELLDSSDATGEGASILEQRIRYEARNSKGWPATTSVALNFTPVAIIAGNAPLSEALEVAKRCKDALGSLDPLEPAALCSPEDAQKAAYDEPTYNDLLARLDSAIKRIIDKTATPPSGIRIRLDIADPKQQASALIEASRLGVADSIPTAQTGDATLSERVDRIKADLDARVAAASAALSAAKQLTEKPKAVKKLLEGFAAVFGKGVTVLPVFPAPGPAGTLQASFSGQALSVGADYKATLSAWLSQVAHVQPGVRRFEDALLAAEAWRTPRVIHTTTAATTGSDFWKASGYEWRAMQMPFDPESRWIGLADGARPTVRPRGVASVVVYAPATLNFSKALAGVLLEQWEEFIPSNDTTAGMALQFDQPGAEAPQVVLIAVPPVWEDAPKPWSPAELVDILCDTLRLSRARLVDLDAQEGLGALAPGIFVPVDPARPGTVPVAPFGLRAIRDFVMPPPIVPLPGVPGIPGIDPRIVPR